MKHPTPKEKRRLIQLTDQLEFFFGVNGYDRSFTYESTADGDTFADITVDISYQRITIAIYPLFWERPLKEQREVILHEFCHILIKPIQSVALDLAEGKFRTDKEREDAIEQSTSMVALRFDSLLRGRSSYAKKAYKKYL